MACRTGHANRHARRFGRQRPELRRFLPRVAYRRGITSARTARCSASSVRSGRSSPSPPRTASTSCGSAVNPQHTTTECAPGPRCARLGRSAHDSLTLLRRSLISICVRRCRILRHLRREMHRRSISQTKSACYMISWMRAGRVDHTRSPAARAGARRDAAQHPPCCDGCVSRKECECAAGIKAAVTKANAKCK